LLEPEKESMRQEIKGLKDIFKEKPGDSEVCLKIARNYSSLNESEESLTHYRKYLKLKPDDSMVHMEIALLYKEEGKLFNSLKHLRLCINSAEDEDLKEKARNYIAEIE